MRIHIRRAPSIYANYIQIRSKLQKVSEVVAGASEQIVPNR